MNFMIPVPALLLAAALMTSAALPQAATAAPATGAGLFGTIEIPSEDLTALPQWQRVILNFADFRKAALDCDANILKCSSQQMTLWRAKMQELTVSAPSVQIREINRFINKWKHQTDQYIYAKADYWASPQEFIVNGGDSEDFVIMKYYSLRELGISKANLRLVVTNDVLRGKEHTVLSVRLGHRQFILDSMTDTVLREDQVSYYVPLYSINETTRWAHIPMQYSAGIAGEGK